MTTPGNDGHHHRSSLKQKNKPFKGGSGRSKSRGRVEGVSKAGGKPGRTLNSVAMTKADRRNQAQLAQAARRAEVNQERRLFSGRSGVPRNIVIVPLSPSVDVDTVMHTLRGDVEAEVTFVEEHRQSLRWIPVKFEDWSVMDTISMADVVVLAVSSQDPTDLEIRPYELLSVMRAQGISSALGYIQHDEAKLGQLKKDLRAEWTDRLTTEMSSISRVFVQADSASRETAECVRALCSQKLAGISWRERRPYMVAESVEYDRDGERLVVTGFSRGGQPFSANRLVHLPGHGTFSVEKISLASPSHATQSDMAVDTMVQLNDPSVSEKLHDDESIEAMETTMSGEDDEIKVSVDVLKKRKIKVKVPKGTSSYQAAWLSDVEEVTADEDEEEVELSDAKAESEDEDTVVDNNMEEDEDDPYEREAHRLADVDSAFPDRISIPAGKTARSTLSTHRGLQSLRTASWDPSEGLPREYTQIVQFEDPARSIHKALHGPVGSPFAVGQRLEIVISGVSVETYTAMASKKQVMLYGLLPYEQRTSLLHFLANPRIHPLQCDGEVVAWIGGIRRLICQPIYSEHNPGVPLHRMIRTVEPGTTAVATIYAPIHFSPSPVLLFSPTTGELLSVGSLLHGSDPRRIILQRSTLTGAPYKIQRRAAVVRWMFDNPEDVAWFKPVELTTKSGRRGTIKASVGTHGHFKALFDKPLTSNEAVALHLHRRVFPSWDTTRPI